MDSIVTLLTSPFSDPATSFEFKGWVAYGMALLLVGAIILQSFVRRETPRSRVGQFFWRRLCDARFVGRTGKVLTGTLVVVAVLISTSYFMREGRTRGYLHVWDAYHTVLGAKYHDELGYFDLYKCTIAVDNTGKRHFRSVREVRDLRTRNFVSTWKHLKDNDCESRFTPERLEAFRRDIDIFGPAMRSSDWSRLFHDKGFNGTPFYTVVVTALLGVNGGTLPELTTITLLDPLLMVLAFGVVGWAFGVRQAAIFAIFFCTFFPNRYLHMGGSILRFDYVAALTCGICLLKKEKWGWAGAFMAWATMVRIFPLLFAGAVVLKIASDIIVDRKISRHHYKFVATYGGGLIALTAVSLMGLDGPLEDWAAWWENMRVHNKASASFRAGFKHLFMLGGSLERVNYGAMQRRFDARAGSYVFAVILMLLPFLLSIRRLSASTFSALFGGVAFFLLVVSTRYYYAVIAMLFLVDKDVFKNRTLALAAATLFGASAFDFFFFGTYENTTLIYNFILGAQMTLVVLIYGFGLLFDPGLDDGMSLPLPLPGSAGAGGPPTDGQHDVLRASAEGVDPPRPAVKDVV